MFLKQEKLEMDDFESRRKIWFLRKYFKKIRRKCFDGYSFLYVYKPEK